jgi:DNA-binding PadR family transcriptional regulator
MRTANAQTQVPISEATFLILLSLSAGPRHGYAIMKDVAALSSGRVHLSTSTLYGAIKRLLEDGWIERLNGEPPDASGRPRKEYRLTQAGRRILKLEAARLESLTRLARLRLEETSQ